MVLAGLSFRILSSIKITIENQKIFYIIYCMLKKILASIFWLLALACMQILCQALEYAKIMPRPLLLARNVPNLTWNRSCYFKNYTELTGTSFAITKNIPIIQTFPVCKKYTKFRIGTVIAKMQRMCQDDLD